MRTNTRVFIASVVLGVTLLGIVPAHAFAASTDATAERIRELLATVEKLQAELRSLLKEREVPTVPLPQPLRTVSIGKPFSLLYNQEVSVLGSPLMLKNVGSASCSDIRPLLEQTTFSTSVGGAPVPTVAPMCAYSLTVQVAEQAAGGKVISSHNLSIGQSKNIGYNLSLTFKGFEGGGGVAVYPTFILNYINSKPKPDREPTISGISGPTKLGVGKMGTWTINASDPEQKTLRYRVVWGDETYARADVAVEASAVPLTVIQNATLSHTYYGAGVYNPVFYVTDEAGNIAKTSISVVVTTTGAEFRVVAPRAGEVWYWYDDREISWQNGPEEYGPYTIYLVPQNYCSVGNACPAIIMPNQIIASGVWGSSYLWRVGEFSNAALNTGMPSGSYQIRTCSAGGSCATSGWFTIAPVIWD